MIELIGHDTAEQAVIVAHYPMGHDQTTTIRYWIHTRGDRQRAMSQTRHARHPERWNAPHVARYAVVVALLRAANGFCEHVDLALGASEAAIVAYGRRYPLTCAVPATQRRLELWTARARVAARWQWTRDEPATSRRAFDQAHAVEATAYAAAVAAELAAIRGTKGGT